MAYDADFLEGSGLKMIRECNCGARHQSRNYLPLNYRLDSSRSAFPSIDNDGVFAPSCQIQVSIPINVRQITSHKPAVIGEGLLRCLDVVEIAFENDRATNLNIACLTRFHLYISRSYDTHLDSRNIGPKIGELEPTSLIRRWTCNGIDGSRPRIRHSKPALMSSSNRFSCAVNAAQVDTSIDSPPETSPLSAFKPAQNLGFVAMQSRSLARQKFGEKPSLTF